MSCKGVKLNHLALRHKEHVHCTNNESISITKASYLISLCSSYLSLRQSNHQMIKLYYLHRFSKQFGYPQDFPRGLLEIFCTGTLEAVYQHWESCTNLPGDESSPKDQFENVVAIRESMPFTLTMQ